MKKTPYIKIKILTSVIIDFARSIALRMSHRSAYTAKTGPRIPAGAIIERATKLVQKVDSVICQANQPRPTF